MQLVYSGFLAFHIAGGFLALAIGLVAMFTPKGARAHRVAGRLYVAGMTATCGSAFVMSVMKPNPFLFMIGVFSYQLAAVGYRSLYLKKSKNGSILPTPLDWAIGLVPAVFNAGMVAWGVVTVVAGNMFGTTGLVFGLFGLIIAGQWAYRFYVPPTDKRERLFKHFQSMGGAYIATATAFLVVNVQFLPPLVVWLTPTVIGTAVITMVTAKYKTRRINLPTAASPHKPRPNPNSPVV